MLTIRLLATALLFGLAAVACTSDEPDQIAAPTTAPTATATIEPTATPWVPPPPVTNRVDIPRVSPGADYPSVGLRDDGVPLAAEGRLVVYAKELRSASDLEVVVFDLTKGERLSSFALEANRQFAVQLAGRRLIASFGRELWSYALDGSDGLLLDDQLPGTQMLASPDGTYVAIAGPDDALLASVAIIEVATGDHVVAIDMVDELPGWMGEPFPVRWLADNDLLVGGLCNCDGLPEGFFDAVVRLDGSAERALNDVPPPRPVSIEVDGGFLPGCALAGFAGSRSIRIVDAVTGEVMAEAADEAPVLIGGELSPDNGEALISLLVADEELRGKLNAALERGDCYQGADASFGEAEMALGLLTVGATALEKVETRLEVLQRWYGELLPVFTCGGEQRAGIVTTDWFDRAAWHDSAGFFAPSGFTSDSCDGRSNTIDMRVGDVPVDTDAQGYRVLGFLDSQPNSED